MINYLKIYTVTGFVKLILNTIRTRLLYSGAKIIRFPFDLRGGGYITWGKGFTTGVNCRLEAYPEDGFSKAIEIGNNVQINDYVHITGIKSVIIGNNVLIASKVYISDSSHGSYAGNNMDSSPLENPSERKLHFKPVKIEDNVWLGEMVAVLPGVTIGKGTIVGAGSVVTRSLPAYVIAVGVPAKPIKMYNFETRIWENINNL